MSRQGLINAVAAAVVALLVLGYWGYSWQQKRALDQSVAALVADAGKLLGEALEGAPEAARAAAQTETAAGLVADLEAMRAAPNRELVEAASQYLITVREVIRRRGASARLRQGVDAARAALEERMRAAGQRSAGWIDEVIAARKRLDTAYFEYRSAVTSLGNLLDELRPVSKALAAHAGMAALLPDEGLRVRARDAARAEAQAAEAEMDKIRKYPPLR
ncbi:MAG: hypothetical protein HYS35_05860 [Betaproteobacteria bacterium]|nr:hypothetical protein [Betaproteobacteria bacterium]